MSIEFDTGTEQLLCEAVDGIATVTFNNPARYNAMTQQIRTALPRALAAVQASDEVRVIVVTGAGDKAFISGADISEFESQRTAPEARHEYDNNYLAMNQAWQKVTKPVIAMVGGYCLGAGMLVLLKTDIRIASEQARFGIPAAKLGLGFAYDGIAMLERAVGKAHAAEILFSARQFDAEEARAMHLVNRVVPPHMLQGETYSLARQIAANAPLTVRACKAGLVQTGIPLPQRDLVLVAEAVEACFDSQDYLEGQAAFAEKRSPRFLGR
ncbi:MAG: enoyl-CoA hydratase [Acidimicrobiia bacterium]